MATLYELTNAYLVLKDALEEAENDADIQACFDTIEDDLNAKVDGYASIRADFKMMVSGIESEIERLQARKISYQKKIENLESRLLDSLDATGKTKFETDKFKVSICKNGGKQPMELLVPVDELPDEFRIIQYKANNDLLRKAVENGDSRFASFKERGRHLRIK